MYFIFQIFLFIAMTLSPFLTDNAKTLWDFMIQVFMRSDNKAHFSNHIFILFLTIYLLFIYLCYVLYCIIYLCYVLYCIIYLCYVLYCIIYLVYMYMWFTFNSTIMNYKMFIINIVFNNFSKFYYLKGI